MSNPITRATSTLLLALLAACSSTAGRTVSASSVAEPLRAPSEARVVAERALLAALERYRVPGLAAAVVHDGELVFTTSLGWADAEQRVPVRDNTLFQLASISKTVTATVVMQQVERGALDLDADIAAVLPFAIRHPAHPDVAITTRMLLTHTAAVRDDWDVLEGTWVQDRDYPLSLADSIAAYFRAGGEYYAPDKCFQEWAPGTQHEYANIGFALLAYIAQCAADEPFEQLVRTGVLEPLGIEGGFRLAEVDVARVAEPHEFAEDSNSFETLGHHAYLDFASGTLRLSASGLARFLQAYQRGGELDGARILEVATIEEMLRVQFPSIDDEQGLAWYRTDALPGDWWGHDGGDPGVATQLLWRRSDGVGIVLLLDAEPSDWDGETEMLEILLGVADERVASRFVRSPHLVGSSLIGAPLRDSSNRATGTARDLLFEPRTGRVVAVVVALETENDAEEVVLIGLGALTLIPSDDINSFLSLRGPIDAALRDAQFVDLFDGQTNVVVEGDVTEVEARDSEGCGAVLLKVRDRKNLLHRVLVEPADLLPERFAAIGVGDPIAAAGVLTRDASGKLLVARSLSHGSEQLELRDAAGAVLWSALARPFASAKDFTERELRTSDGASVVVLDWLLDQDRGAVAYLCLDVGGVRRALPWSEVRADGATGAWTIARDRAALGALPIVAPDGSVLRAP